MDMKINGGIQKILKTKGLIMPIPFLIAGLGVAAGALGVMGHSEAKGTNEKAQSVSRKAQKLYEDVKDSLEVVQKET